MLQEVWRCTIKWDDQISEKTNKVWQQWIQKLESCKSFSVPRCYGFSQMTRFTLHVFVDASEQAYAAVAYLTRDDEVAFIAGKCRVAPLKAVTIPRLELQAAIMGARLGRTILKLQKVRRVFWTNSRTVWRWIRGRPRKKDVFVSNRLSAIDELTAAQEWRWLPGSLNVADEATRANQAVNFSRSRWVTGPDFLRLPEVSWPTPELQPETEEEDCEDNHEAVLAVEAFDSLVDYDRFSNWRRLKRCVTYILLFLDKCRRSATHMIPNHEQRAELFLVKQAQADSFTEEITAIGIGKTIKPQSRLWRLNPYLDKCGLLRLKSRLESGANLPQNLKTPIILDAKHYVVKLMIEHQHRQFGHHGTATLINELRQNYYILRLRNEVRSLLARCVICKIRIARCEQPTMAGLPQIRLQHHCRVAFGKLRQIFASNLPQSLKTKVYDQCVLPVMTYGSETWPLTMDLILYPYIHLKRRFGVDSLEQPSSPSRNTEPSRELPSTSAQPRSSVQSPAPKASSTTDKAQEQPTKKPQAQQRAQPNKNPATSKTTPPKTNPTKTTNTKPSSKAPDKTEHKAEAKTPKSNESKPNNDENKKAVTIRENPLDEPDVQIRVADSKKVEPAQGECSHREKRSTAPSQRSFDSGEQGVQPFTSGTQPATGTEPSLGKKRTISFESLSSVSALSDCCDSFDSAGYIVLRNPRSNTKHEKEEINTELRYALSQSIPISSETVYEPLYPALPEHSYPFSLEVSTKRQRSASFQLDESPPSPAPGTPPVRDHRRTRSCDCVETQPGRQYPKLPDDTQYGAGPRIASVIYGSRQQLCDVIEHDKSKRYRRVSIERKSQYGHKSSPQPQRTFAETIHDQFRIRRRGLAQCSSTSSMLTNMDEHERKVIIEFCHLLEKSKQLFNGLRELPQYGHKQWSMYFGRTFDIYTRLWKYQQQHRAVLDSKYGMKRWQIGEIASKIGQLYYHFYLRTSETGYLNEAFSFYYAIRGRCYYTKANKEDKCELMVKKLRYYARFIVVCLLLKKMKLVKDLIKELDRQIIEYGNTYDPDDQVEWTVVVDEVKAFIHAEPVVAIIDHDNYSVVLTNRMTPMSSPTIERTSQMNLSLQEILIVGSSSQQVKFSELTMDMFRMLLTLEREPTGDVQHHFDESPRARYTSTPNAPHIQDEREPPVKLPNPHKYLLFKPSPSQVLVYLASGFNDLPPNGALLLYLSADGHMPQAPKHAEDVAYDMGGLITTSKNDIYRECSRDPKAPSASKFKELQCLYPGDLYPFTRRPFFVIVDSDNSYAFQNIPRHFGQPMVILMSPLELPASFHDRRQQGSLFTLFLHSPLTAFCYCCDISNISLVHWDRAQQIVDDFIAESAIILVRSRVDISYIAFLGDDFLRVLILRYIFCETVLRLHRGFRSRSHLTRCSPTLPDDLFEHPSLVRYVTELAGHLQVRSHFHDPTIASGPPTTKE